MRDIIFFVGAKGGSGATTVAMHVAKRMSANSPVVFVDGDLSGRRSGGVLFKVIPALDVLRNRGDYAITEVGPGLLLYEIAGSIHDGYSVKFEHVEEMLTKLPAEYQTIIVDAAQPFAAVVRPLAVRASRFIVVVEPSTLGVTGARVMQLELTKFGVPASRLEGVLCMRDARNRSTAAEIERVLSIPMLGEVPPLEDRRFDKSIEMLVDKMNETAVHSDELLVLQPSASGPIGERRLGRKGDHESEERAANSKDKRSMRKSGVSDATRDKLKADIHHELSRRIDFVAVGGASADQLHMDQLRIEAEAAIAEILAKRGDIGSAEYVANLRREIIDEALGLGPLEELMRDIEVTEIMVNGPDDIYIERKGLITKTERRFNDSKQLRLVIERIISPLGRHIDEATPMVDARLPDGSRVNATIEPLSIDGPTITVRRFAKYRLQVADLVEKSSWVPAMADLLRACVEGRLNVVISGGTGSGKTTLLNVLSGFIPTNERILTIEDAAELQLHQEHVVRMEARPANVEGRGEIRIRDLVRNALRMRPDRIVVGECRGGEALDMLQAMNTGHDGSLTTIHSNSPRDCLSRIETMVLMAGYEIPVRAIREQVAGAVDVVVQVERMRDGTRKIVSISEVVGMEGDIVTMQEIVRFDQRGVGLDGGTEGAFVFTGVQPNFMKRFTDYGIHFDIKRLSELELATASW